MSSSVLSVLLSGGDEVAFVGGAVANPTEEDGTPETASAEEPRLGVRSGSTAGVLSLLRASMKTHTPAGPPRLAIVGQRPLSGDGWSRWPDSLLGDGSPILLERDAS